MKEKPIVVIGSGAAGLSAALAASKEKKEVLILTKGEVGDKNSSSYLAQGGIAAAIGKNDSSVFHTKDTLIAGGELCEEELVDLLTSSAPEAIHNLISLGAKFDLDASGNLHLGKEAAHSNRRIVHARGAETGKEVMHTLSRKIRENESIKIISNVTVDEIILSSNGECGGLIIEKGGKRSLIEVSGCILATGGIGNLYQFTTNPSFSNGDGIALAALAGAKLIDLEFVQFHPTALDVKNTSRHPLISEALRGEGAFIVDDRGERFLFSAHKEGELAPRDIVAREVFLKKMSGSSVWIDSRKAIGDRFKDKFPNLHEICVLNGINPAKELIPIVPAAHYHMGGVLADSWGKTSIPNLWACGEVASIGVHGANRLASNSLLEALVFGARAGIDASCSKITKTEISLLPTLKHSSKVFSLSEENRIKSLMWENVGLIREKKGLKNAFDKLFDIQKRKAGPLKKRALVSSLIAYAALYREESRGSHFRSDFPYSSETFKKRFTVQFTKENFFEVETQAA